ncbi:disks large-associated protein 1 [Galendromus occidentalis]|uniref:Disks large-associated protein 1 n=1 Tax=Galendromus occidentalis TaxID=34638 RepID=A0AAJ7L319_9ACAR|nr:disks large-associated protein 1 [Galendromus occidentalis]
MTPGHEFLVKLETAEAEIRARSEKINHLQTALPEDNREDISSRIDMAVGSGALLLKGKCKQFRELCLKNIAEAGAVKDKESSAQFPTTEADLEGFWDMISLPIQKVMESFTAIERLKENGWREPEENTSDTKKTTKSAVQKKKPLASKNDAVESNKHNEEARRRLMEFKKAIKNRQERELAPKDPLIIE